MGPILRWYVVQELISPTLLALGGLTALVLTKDLLGFSDLVLNRGFGAFAVMLIALYELVPLLTRTLPFAVLIGILVGLGRLRADLEILSMETAGIAVRRLVSPVLIWGWTATAAGLLLSLFTTPWSLRSLDQALKRLSAENPGFALRAGTVYDFSGVKMIAREVSARGDRLRGVLLWLPEEGQTLFSERGEIVPLGNRTTQLTLYAGVMLPSPPKREDETRFGTYQHLLRENPAPPPRAAEQLAGEPLHRIVSLIRNQSAGEQTAFLARTELHHRLAYPTAALVLSLLAVPLALAGQSFSRAAGGITGLVVTVVYYGLMQLGDGLLQARIVGPALGVWLPNVLIVTFALICIWRVRQWSTWGRTSETRDEKARLAIAENYEPRIRRFVLERYVTRQYLTMLFFAFGVLFVGYLLVDVLERLQWFARHNAPALTILRFYGARSPLLASRVLPMALLLATALTVSLLSAQREIIGMRACGVSVSRALIPILLIAGLHLPGYFFLNESIVPQTNARADQLKNEEIKKRGPESGGRPLMIWYQDNSHLYQANQLDPKLGRAQELVIYELDDNGLPVSRIDAPAATHIGEGVWELTDPVRIGISEQGLQPLPADSRIVLGEAPNTTIDTMHLNVKQLARAITDAEARGYSAVPYRVDFNIRLASPLACILLPAAALFFAISGPPFPGPAVTILACTALGVLYILLTGVGASLGYGEILPPVLAGWGPPTLVGGLVVFLAAREHG
ncbi:MAG: LptF/LptG family permease [Candidatus Binatia bacterium]